MVTLALILAHDHPPSSPHRPALSTAAAAAGLLRMMTSTGSRVGVLASGHDRRGRRRRAFVISAGAGNYAGMVPATGGRIRNGMLGGLGLVDRVRAHYVVSCPWGDDRGGLLLCFGVMLLCALALSSTRLANDRIRRL